jgi:hypothetical protein
MPTTEASCPYCGPGVRTYRDEGDQPDAAYCARCGHPIRYWVALPFSEVCMFMGVAGKSMLVEYVSSCAVQLYDDAGRAFSFPITTSEAGVR